MQKEEITNSLKLVTRIFSQCNSQYRILGSIILVAYKQEIFREIHDIDILLDQKSEDCVLKKLKGEGFELKKRQWGSFSWIEAYKKNYLGLTFFLVGDFTADFFRYQFSKWGELRVNNDYIKPTSYKFNGIPFTGIPITSAIAGIYQAFLNPKRSIDKQLLAHEIATLKIKKYNNINIFIGGLKIPFMYDTFSFLYNLYGGFRVRFGKKYEVWD